MGIEEEIPMVQLWGHKIAGPFMTVAVFPILPPRLFTNKKMLARTLHLQKIKLRNLGETIKQTKRSTMR